MPLSNIWSRGAYVISFGEHPITREQLDLIDRVTDFERGHYDHITRGDRGEPHDIRKLALRSDLEEIADDPINLEILRQIEPIIGSKEMFDTVYKKVDPLARTLRKVQINLLPESGFVGPHIDRESNPQWLMACVLQLSKQYEGGEYVIDINGGKKFTSQYGSLLIARTDVVHWVNPVTSGIRKTLVYFIGMNSGPNPNRDKLVKPGEY